MMGFSAFLDMKVLTVGKTESCSGGQGCGQ